MGVPGRGVGGGGGGGSNVCGYTHIWSTGEEEGDGCPGVERCGHFIWQVANYVLHVGEAGKEPEVPSPLMSTWHGKEPEIPPPPP